MRARPEDRLCWDCQDAKTGESVPVIVAINVDAQEYVFVPLARLCVGNPYAEFLPPNPEGGYFSE